MAHFRWLLIIGILTSMAFSYQNCSKANFSEATQSSSFTTTTLQSCISYVDPMQCPMPANHCPGCDSGAAISRYRGLIKAFQSRGTPLCVIAHNIFFGDTNCDDLDPNAFTDPNDFKCYRSAPNAPNMRDCIDAAAAQPVITVGVGSSHFGHAEIIQSQAIAFAVRANVESICGTLTRAITEDRPEDRKAQLSTTSSLWAYSYLAVAWGVVPLGQISTESQVSDAFMTATLAATKVLLNSYTCEQLQQIGLDYLP